MRHPRTSRRPRYGSGYVTLIDGPLDGCHGSGDILRSRLECDGGVYLYVLGGDPMCLYWVEQPLIVDTRFAVVAVCSGCAVGVKFGG